MPYTCLFAVTSNCNIVLYNNISHCRAIATGSKYAKFAFDAETIFFNLASDLFFPQIRWISHKSEKNTLRGGDILVSLSSIGTWLTRKRVWRRYDKGSIQQYVLIQLFDISYLSCFDVWSILSLQFFTIDKTTRSAVRIWNKCFKMIATI